MKGLTKKLEVAMSDRDIFKKSHQMAETETERVRAELAHKQAE